MDVRCENCGTEYEFDDAKVSESGITVKCTHCNHLFRVSKPRAMPPIPPAIGMSMNMRAGIWMIRTRAGELFEMQDLSMLPTWIAQGKVTRVDELSRDGENWQPLGTLTEFAQFFNASDGGGVGSISTRSSAFGSSESRFDDSKRNAIPPMIQNTGFNPALASSANLSFGESFAEMARQQPQAQATQGSGGWRTGVMAALFVIAAGCAGWAGWTYYKMSEAASQPTPPVAKALPCSEQFLDACNRAREEMGRDTQGGFSQAQKFYQEALNTREGCDGSAIGNAYVGLARAAICEAEYKKLESQDATQLLENATKSLKDAEGVLGSRDASLLINYADLYRVKGDVKRAEDYLNAAEEAGAAAIDVSLVRGAMEMHLQNGNVKSMAERLSALSPATQKQPRAQFLMALAFYKAQQNDEARKVIMALLARNPDHGPANRLLAHIALTPEKNQKNDQANAPEEKQTPPKTPTPPKTGGDNVSADSGNYDQLMSKAHKLLSSGNSAQARKFFDAASKKKPTSPEPWAGLAWCALDEGQAGSAVSLFKKSLGANPRYAESMYGLAESLEKSGNKGEAIKAYNAYLQTHPNGQYAGMVQRKLNQLR